MHVIFNDVNEFSDLVILGRIKGQYKSFIKFMLFMRFLMMLMNSVIWLFWGELKVNKNH